MGDGDCSSDIATVRIWRARADLELAKLAASELPRGLFDHLQKLPEPSRSRRVVQQALRRSVLASYAGVEPVELELAFAPGGPVVSPIDGLLVSASHFDDVTTFAVGDRGLSLGVDVEPSFERDWEEALEMALTESELGELNEVHSDLRAARYFKLWTLKESVMKALGDGLGDRDPGSIEIAVTEDRPRLMTIDGHAPSEPWALWSGPVEDHIFSVALRGVSTVEPTIISWPVETVNAGC